MSLNDICIDHILEKKNGYENFYPETAIKCPVCNVMETHITHISILHAYEIKMSCVNSHKWSVSLVQQEDVTFFKVTMD
jgi:hypothetical protein